MAHTIPYSNTQIDNAIGVGKDIYGISGIPKINGAGGVSAAVPGTDYITNPAFPVVTTDSNIPWNRNVLRPATGTSAISAVAPSVSSYGASIHGIFKASGATTTFTVASAYVIDADGNKSASAGAGLAITTTADSVYEFDLYAISATQALLVIKEWTL